MIYEMQLRRKKAATELASDLKSHGPVLAKLLEPRMTAVLEEGEEMPDVAHLLDVLGRMLERESEELEAAADARSKEGAAVSYARRELRQHAEQELRSRVIWVRDQMRSAYGAKEAGRLLEHVGRTPRAREALRALADHMVSFLPTVVPPKVKVGPPPDPVQWAEYVRPALVKFSRYLKVIEDHSGGRAEAVDLRNEVMVAFDRTYSRVIRLTELFYKLCGEDELARKLWRQAGRPSEQVNQRAASVA